MTASSLSMDFQPAADAAPAAAAAGSVPGVEADHYGDGDGDGELDALVQRARTGDDAAFAELVGILEKRTFHFVLRLLGNTHDAEDVTQDTFVKAWHSLPRYRPQHHFRTWLFTIARRTALNHLRARRPMEELKDHDMAIAENPGDSAAGRGDAADLWNTARRLKPDQYEALWLCYGEGFAVSEAARIMNTNALRLRVLLHRARKRMAGWLTVQSLQPPPTSLRRS